MKYVVALVAGIVSGIVLFALLIYNNPFSATPSVSPLAVADERVITLQYTAVPVEAIAFTNDGESISRPHPQSIAELREPTVRDTRLRVVGLTDSRGQPAGIGIKFESDSEDTRILKSEAIVDSAWHLFLPELGSLFIEQQENYWSYLHDIVVAARLNAADNWRGRWIGIMTTGPNALGTGRAFGGSGLLAGMESEAVESLSAAAYSLKTGPVAMNGSLDVLIPEAERFTPGDN